MRTTDLIKVDEPLTFIVPEDAQPVRLDVFLQGAVPTYSRSFFQRAIEDGFVTINGNVITKSSHVIKVGNSIVVNIPPKREITPGMVKEADIPVKIIDKQDHFIIISKPAGLTVHPPTSTSTDITLSDWLLHNIEGLAHVGSVDRPGIIHRLDKDTSGLMIIPRTTYGYTQFGSLFHDRKIDKTYYAVVKGHPDKQGTIDLSIARHPIERTKMTTFEPGAPHPNGSKIRHAVTHYKVLKYFDDAALVRITLETGRTHQIRVHFAAIGHPIIGDTAYGQPSHLIGRQALHAQGLAFTFDDKKYLYERELPEDMQLLVEKLKPLEE